MPETTVQSGYRPLKAGLFVVPDRLDVPVTLTGNRCPACGAKFFPARAFCARCSGRVLEPQTFGPEGVVQTYTIVRQTLPGSAMTAPYAIVDVAMTGGVTAQSVLLDVPLEDVRIGLPVEAVVRQVLTDDDGAAVVNFCFRAR